MSFLNPWAFLGLLSLPAIIALHWHFQRNSRVVVSSMFLWRFLDEKFQGNKMNFLHISWLLILDLLIALLLTLALTRPVLELPAFGNRAHQQVILLDDSTSMLALEGDSDRISAARELAAGIIENSGPNDEFVLITFGGKADLAVHTADASASGLATMVRGLGVSGMGEDLRAALAIANRLEDRRLPQNIYVITDGAYSLPFLDDFTGEIEWIFVGDGSNNQAVLDLTFERGRQSQSELFFRLANYSDQPVTREVEISVDGSPLTSLALRLPPNSITPQTVTLTGVGDSVSVRLLGLDQMPDDDVAFLGTGEESLVKVAILADNPYPLDRAIQTIPGTSLAVVSSPGSITDGTYDLVIYRDQVPSVWPSGIVLLFESPPTNSVIPVGVPVQVNSLAEVAPGTLLDGAGLESVRWGYAADLSHVEDFESLASVDGMSIILQQKTDKSEVYIFSPILDAGNFTKHPAFPILLSRFVNHARDVSPQPAYRTGDILTLPEGDVSIQIPSGNKITSDQTRQVTLSESGLYNYTAYDALGSRQDAYFGVNPGEVEESNITPRDWRTEVTIYAPEAEKSWQRVDVHLGPWLLGLAVLLLLIEAWRAWR